MSNQSENQTVSQETILKEIKQSSFFIVAALSPSFLISVVSVFFYLTIAYPEIKEPVSNAISNLLKKAGVNKETSEK